MKVVRSVTQGVCGDRAYSDAISHPNSIIVDTVSDAPNVAAFLKLDGRPVHDEFDDDSRDLIALATAVYIADETVARSTAPDTWTRSYDVIFPVADPTGWRRATPGLMTTLRFLSGDRWSFEWPQRGTLPSSPLRRARLPSGIEAVCLYSGGMDSLLGADKLLAEGRKVLLVGHFAEGATAEAQASLVGMLRSRYPGQVWLVQASIAGSRRKHPNHALPKPEENTHRVRSFLFLAIAIAFARTLRVSEVFIPENGLIAINAPTQVSRAGSCSTRTAHPRFLLELKNFLQKSGLYAGTIRNPFFFQSKNDMIRRASRDLYPLLSRSVSCARPNRYKDRGVRHCGYCVPCIYRRLAMATAGLDVQADYAFSVLEDPSLIRGEKGADLRAVASFAKAVSLASPTRRDDIVLSHGFFPPSAGGEFGPHETQTYAPWSDMMLRWSNDFVKTGVRFHHDVRRALELPSLRKRKA